VSSRRDFITVLGGAGCTGTGRSDLEPPGLADWVGGIWRNRRARARCRGRSERRRGGRSIRLHQTYGTDIVVITPGSGD
jgi:hypothetical protein